VIATIILPSRTISLSGLSYVPFSFLAHDYSWSPFEALREKNALRGDGVCMINCTIKETYLPYPAGSQIPDQK
jgi:hypothetical protein